MKFLEFLNTVKLFEAARDRYAQMFTNLLPLANQHGTQAAMERDINKAVDWAMNVLKKQDKIVWYLRLAKVGMLQHRTVGARKMAADFGDDSDVGPAARKTADFFQSAYEKTLGQLAKKMGIAPNLAVVAVDNAMSHGFKTEMEHLMSLDIPTYEEYVFSNQSPDQIFADWYPIEEAWKKKRKATFPIDREGIDTIIKYPDGSEWVNLNKEYCDAEGMAMGHCGNTAQPREGDTVLSYRTIEEVDGEKLWKPRLTFILNTKTGLLGETKGRANQKPDQKYHDVIVDLLKKDFVKGIKGGGYEAHNNFHFDDLSPEVQEELAEEKPGLATIRYDYNKRGMTKDLLNRIEATWDGARYRTSDGSLDRKKNLEYKDNQFYIQTWLSLEEFIEDHGGPDAKWAYDIITGMHQPANDHEAGLKMEIDKQLKKYLDELPNDGKYSLSLTPGWEEANANQIISIPEEEMVGLLTRYDSQQESRGPGGFDLAAGIIRYAGINNMEFHNEAP